MAKETYKVLEDSSVINLDNETVRTLKKGEEITGEFVLIDENPFVELPDGFVSTDKLAEKLGNGNTQAESHVAESTVRSSNKKLIYSLVGAALGFAVAHFLLKKGTKGKILFTIGGLALGLTVEYISSRKK